MIDETVATPVTPEAQISHVSKLPNRKPGKPQVKQETAASPSVTTESIERAKIQLRIDEHKKELQNVAVHGQRLAAEAEQNAKEQEQFRALAQRLSGAIQTLTELLG